MVSVDVKIHVYLHTGGGGGGGERKGAGIVGTDLAVTRVPIRKSNDAESAVTDPSFLELEQLGLSSLSQALD